MRHKFVANAKVTTKSGTKEHTVESVMEDIKKELIQFGDAQITGFIPHKPWSRDGGMEKGMMVVINGEIESPDGPLVTAHKVAFEISKGHYVTKLKTTDVKID